MHLYRFTTSRRRRIAAAGLAAATIASGLLVTTVAAPSAATPATAQTLTWGPCAGIPAVPGVPASECATLTVPRDWDNPGAGPTLSIAISRVRATDPAHRKGILFTNPGGPSGSGLALPDRLVRAHPKVATDYDVIGMDPRGVGASTKLVCDVAFSALWDSMFYDSRDNSPEASAANAKQGKAIADGCAKNPLTPFINTWQTVYDMDAIRAALGEEKLNYVGYSYGSWLGAKYAAVFPQNTGKVVLDSNTAWTDDLATTWQAMPNAMQRRLDKQFLPWIARHPVFSKYVGTTPEQATATYEAGRAGYVAFASPFRRFGASLDSIIIQGIYTDKTFFDTAVVLSVIKCYAGATGLQDLGKILTCVIETAIRLEEDLQGYPGLSTAVAKGQAVAKAALDQDPKSWANAFGSTPFPELNLALAAAKQGPPPSTDEPGIPVDGTYFAVRCGDGGQWKSPQWWANFRQGITPQNWLVGYQLTGTEVCSYWTAPTHELPNPNEHQLSQPLVLVQSEFDPATAYENATRDAAQYHNARLISVQDYGTHGVYAIRGNGCVDDIIDAWLLNDVEPATSTICGSAPLLHESVVYPVPGPVDGKQNARPATIRPVDPKLEADLTSMIGSTH